MQHAWGDEKGVRNCNRKSRREEITWEAYAYIKKIVLIEMDL
jgi:hypothetical protein